MQAADVASFPRSRIADAAAVEVAEADRAVFADQNVVRVEVGVIDAHAMQARDGGADRAPNSIAQRMRGELGAQRARARDAFRDQIASITQARALVAGADRLRHGQAALSQL